MMNMGSGAVQDQASMCAEGVVQNKGGVGGGGHVRMHALDRRRL